MHLSPFSPGTRFYRGNLHGHSTHSDGSLSSAEVVEVYHRLGYDFTCLSDHLHTNTQFAATTVNDTAALNRDDFITITSAELHCSGKAYDNDGLWHILANGLPVDFAVASEDETAPQMVQRALDAGAFVSIAHPEWYCMTMGEAATIAKAHAVEILNYSCEITSSRGGGTAVIDYLFNEGHRPGIIATDDSHVGVNDVGGGWVMVAETGLDADAIITALKAGTYYASSGAEIHDVTFADGMLNVECSPASSVIVAGAGHLERHITGKSITRATFDLRRFNSPFFRVIVKDMGGQEAWTNAWFFDTLDQ